MKRIIEKAKIVDIQAPRKSIWGGMCQKVIFRDMNDNKEYRYWFYPELDCSKRFSPYIELGKVFYNLSLSEGKAPFILGTSDFRVR